MFSFPNNQMSAAFLFTSVNSVSSVPERLQRPLLSRDDFRRGRHPGRLHLTLPRPPQPDWQRGVHRAWRRRRYFQTISNQVCGFNFLKPEKLNLIFISRPQTSSQASRPRRPGPQFQRELWRGRQQKLHDRWGWKLKNGLLLLW